MLTAVVVNDNGDERKMELEHEQCPPECLQSAGRQIRMSIRKT